MSSRAVSESVVNTRPTCAEDAATVDTMDEDDGSALSAAVVAHRAAAVRVLCGIDCCGCCVVCEGEVESATS